MQCTECGASGCELHHSASCKYCNVDIYSKCEQLQTELDTANGKLRAKPEILSEMNSWFEKLMPFLAGEKKWDTGCLWVCESHPMIPFDMGYTFDCKCGAPGMSPYMPQSKAKVIESFRKQCEKSLSPDVYTKLIEEIIPALKLTDTEANN